MTPRTSHEPADCAEDTGGPLGVVVIGRNEGARLVRCLQSLRAMADRTVYVDSGSADGSLAAGRAFGVVTMQLDPGRPFTAARARREGFERLLSLHPALEYVLFVDGDCEVMRPWPASAGSFMALHPDVAIVCGRRREKYPERSIYNRLCDLEWQEGPMGETPECGGDALIRVAAFRQVGGYRADLICGEEPELCVRLRQAGWRIWRLDEEMTVHDAAMYRFKQWWRRMQRGGYAFAQGAHLHGASAQRHGITQSRRAWIWGLCIPVCVVAASALLGYAALALLLVYPLQVSRVALRGTRSTRDNWLRALAVVLAKFPEVLGQMTFVMHNLGRVQTRLIEYK